jgi:hypothetical protein
MEFYLKSLPIICIIFAWNMQGLLHAIYSYIDTVYSVPMNKKLHYVKVIKERCIISEIFKFYLLRK